MYTLEERREIFRRLAEPLPEEAVERTRGAETKKGYDTCGYRSQYVLNRLNEVLGVGGYRIESTFNLRERATKNATVLYEATCDLVMQLGAWQDGKFVPFAEACGTGGHTALAEADAKKGSQTNGIKKVAAMFGVGWRAYAGCIDDDNAPGISDEGDEPHKVEEPEQPARWSSSKNSEPRTSVKSNGRITSAQLGKLKELVSEVGGDWRAYQGCVREEHGVTVEYTDRKLASQLIDELVATSRRRRTNGPAAEAQ